MRTSRVAKYEIIDEIGHGGMATVYRARDTRLDRMVALKVMHPHLQGAKEARTRFAREAVTIARLKHPNILEIYDYSGEEGDTHYIATELLTGPTLKQLVDDHPDMPAEIAACLAILITRALSAAHAEGVIHRDVKPENVMMHDNRAVKLTDFGIAQLVDVQGMTVTGQVLGSPAHMAPEQIEGKDCDARSDIFSLGTVLYLLATGHLPFQGRNAHQVLKQIMEGQFREPLMVKPQIGGRLRNIIVRCLKVDPAQRYATAKEVEDDLMAFVRAAGIDNPGEVIARYLQGTRAFSATFRSRIIEAETALGMQAMKSGDVPRAMDAFNRVLAIDERNEQVLSLVHNLGRRQQLRRWSTWAMAVISLAVVVGVLFNARVVQKPEGDLPGKSDSGATNPGTGPVAPGAVAANGPNDAAKQTGAQRPTGTAPGAPSATPIAQPTAADSADRGQGRGAAAKPEVAQPPVDPSAPRHVVLRPIPANVSIGIDGAPLQAFGPSFRAVDLKPGPHVFAFQGALDCCVDETITVNIPPGPGTYVVSHRLRFRAANLIVASNTPAYVVIDEGKARGRTWSVITVQQPNDMIGMHVVRVSADGHRDVVREVRLRAGQLERIEVTLEKVPEVAPPPG
ncbi:MAG TPA: protein kinase [Polyangiales bacterium]|jgi:serine/threonine-protein kinase|nr:protein kinase [Polyangiales bacterium]